MSVLMADSTRPHLIPSTFKYALVYINGQFEWTTDQVDRFAGHVNISVTRNASQAAEAREIDVEPKAAQPGDVPAFLAERKRLGHDDGTVYCSRSAIAAVQEACDAAKVKIPRWHIATLDGTKRVPVPSGILWAVQYETVAGRYDVSIVYGPLDFTPAPR